MFKSTHQRNWFAFFMDHAFFGLGLTFINSNTIMTAFVATLTTSKIMVGLTPAIWFGAWLIPQLFAARYLARKPKKFGYMIWGSLIGRPAFWVVALLLVSGVFAQQPITLLIVFLLSVIWFAGVDAFVAIAFFDLYGKTLDSKARGQVASWALVLNSVIAIGAGWLISFIFSDKGLPYPLNFAATFTLGGICFFISLFGLLFVVEPSETTAPTLVHQEEPRIATILKDKLFVHANLVRLIGGLSGLAIPFYVLHATQEAKLSTEIIGGFAAVSSIGGAIAGITLGKVSERYGSHRVFQITTWLAVLPPLLGLALTLTPASAASLWIYLVCYFLIGGIEGAVSIGFFNYIIDIAPAPARTKYVGLTNTIGGLLILPPVLGGWILETTSYSLLFTITLLGVAVASVVALNLKAAHQPLP